MGKRCELPQRVRAEARPSCQTVFVTLWPQRKAIRGPIYLLFILSRSSLGTLLAWSAPALPIPSYHDHERTRRVGIRESFEPNMSCLKSLRRGFAALYPFRRVDLIFSSSNSHRVKLKTASRAAAWHLSRRRAGCQRRAATNHD